SSSTRTPSRGRTAGPPLLEAITGRPAPRRRGFQSSSADDLPDHVLVVDVGIVLGFHGGHRLTELLAVARRLSGLVQVAFLVEEGELEPDHVVEPLSLEEELPLPLLDDLRLDRGRVRALEERQLRARVQVVDDAHGRLTPLDLRDDELRLRP